MVKENTGLDAEKEDCKAALCLSAQNNHLDLVDFLVLNGAKVNKVDKNGYTMLHRAVKENRINIAEELMSYAVDVNCAGNDLNTPLHLACQRGNLEMVNLLLEKGADVSVVGEHGYTPLHWAAQNGSIKIVSMLLKHNSSLSSRDQWNNTPLHLAALGGHAKTVQYLTKKGASLEALENENKTPLQLAQQEGYTKVAGLLRLMAFKQMRKEFDRKYGNDDNGGIKREIEEELFKTRGVVAVGSGVNRAWKETGRYGGLCILVEVSVDPEEFKADHPEYKNEPYFIRHCGISRFWSKPKPHNNWVSSVQRDGSLDIEQSK